MTRYIHAGRRDVTAYDRQRFLDFTDRHL